MTKTIRHILYLLLLLKVGNTYGQNYLYNTEQFGLTGSMLGGVVTAGTDDIGMIYYNPAAIFKVAHGLDISLIQPRVNVFGFKQFWAETHPSNLGDSFGLKPALLSYKTDINGRDVAFIKIGRSDFNDTFNSKIRTTDSNNIMSFQSFEYKYKGKDDWYGIGTSFDLNNKWHFGISQFLSISSFHYFNDVLIERSDMSNPSLPQTHFYKNTLLTSYNNVGFITKVGWLFDSENNDFGVTITTPLFLRIVRGGDLNKTIVEINNGEKDRATGAIDQGISTLIKTPWEFNFGYSHKYNSRIKLWVNAIYSSRINDYSIGQINTLSQNLDWLNGSKPVFNFGLGFTDQISPRFELSGGVRSNNFAYENKEADDDVLRQIILDGDHFHFTLSTRLISGNHTILIGFDYGRVFNVPDDNQYNELLQVDELQTDARNLTNSDLSLLLTYGFILSELFKK